MDQEAVKLFQALARAGAIPGEDFWFDAQDETFRFTEHGYQLLKQKYPQIDWDAILGVVDQDVEQVINSLHQHLGVNFVDRILERINLRLGELPDGKAAWYLRQILGGVEQRTGISLYLLLGTKLNLSRQARVECLLHLEAELEPCGEWICDLVQAAGGSFTDAVLEQGDAVLTEQGMRLLAEVWMGECDLYAELARG